MLMNLLGTQEVKAYDTWINGIKYVLVDTPGFDDPMKSDTAVVDGILQWLEKSYRDGRQLSGITYLHSIAEPKMQGSALRNMRIFRKLCGPECYKNVVLATTFWNEVSKSTGEKREKELADKDEFWGMMVKKRSQIVRLEHDKESALNVISLIGQEDKITLQAQKEIILLNKSRDETAAAELVNEQAKKLAQERQQRLEEEREKARRELAVKEAEKKRAAGLERAALAAKMRAQERINREQQEQRKREEKEVQESKQRAKEEAAIAEGERVVKEKARINEREDAQRRRQLAATQAAAKKRADYYRLFRCANITPRGKCDKCGSKLSRWKYYYRKYHALPRDYVNLKVGRLLPLLLN